MIWRGVDGGVYYLFYSEMFSGGDILGNMLRLQEKIIILAEKHISKDSIYWAEKKTLLLEYDYDIEINPKFKGLYPHLNRDD